MPRDTWEALFRSQGMKNPLPRIRMLDGFNEGWIEFEAGESGSRKGNCTIDTASLVSSRPTMQVQHATRSIWQPVNRFPSRRRITSPSSRP